MFAQGPFYGPPSLSFCVFSFARFSDTNDETSMSLLSYAAAGALLQPAKSQREQTALSPRLSFARMSLPRRTCTQTPGFLPISRTLNCKSVRCRELLLEVPPGISLSHSSVVKISSLISPDLPCRSILSTCIHESYG